MLPPYAELIFNMLSEDTIVLAIAIWESAKTDTHLYYSTTQKNRLLIKIEPLREAPFNIPRQITSMWNNLALRVRRLHKVLGTSSHNNTYSSYIELWLAVTPDSKAQLLGKFPKSFEKTQTVQTQTVSLLPFYINYYVDI